MPSRQRSKAKRCVASTHTRPSLSCLRQSRGTRETTSTTRRPEWRKQRIQLTGLCFSRTLTSTCSRTGKVLVEAKASTKARARRVRKTRVVARDPRMAKEWRRFRVWHSWVWTIRTLRRACRATGLRWSRYPGSKLHTQRQDAAGAVAPRSPVPTVATCAAATTGSARPVAIRSRPGRTQAALRILCRQCPRKGARAQDP
mmetsp:Transcript_7664/g.18378  ORF Transcript_7664/g.18378 Transcript_7664/m.18378 type:complete len:200 (+) Transcript_7664:764-1363(+)